MNSPTTIHNTSAEGAVAVMVKPLPDGTDPHIEHVEPTPENVEEFWVEAAEDVVNHPAHYTVFPVEVIELTEHLNFCRGNAVKYIARAGLKDPATEVEDLRKARWYIDRELERIAG